MHDNRILKGVEEIFVTAGERFNIEIEVSDADGHDVELLFPNAPLGLNFESTQRKGYWDVPQSYFSDHVTLQILAVDEKGGAGVLFVTHHLNEVELPGRGLSASVWGTIDQSTSTAEVYYAYNEWCQWSSNSVALDVIEPCPDCTHSWSLNVALSSSEECFSIGEATRLDIGWAPTLTVDGVELTDVMLMKHDDQWSYAGTGSWEEDKLSFNMQMYTEIPDTGWFEDIEW